MQKFVAFSEYMTFKGFRMHLKYYHKVAGWNEFAGHMSEYFLFVYVLNTTGHFFMGKEKGRALLNTTGYFFMGIENGRFS